MSANMVEAELCACQYGGGRTVCLPIWWRQNCVSANMVEAELCVCQYGGGRTVCLPICWRQNCVSANMVEAELCEKGVNFCLENTAQDAVSFCLLQIP